MSKTYEIEIQKDEETGDAFFEIPPELLKNLGWKTGDDLKWEETDEGVRLRKVKYETVELEFNDEEYFKFLRFAHENNMSFNELVEESVKEAMKNNEKENGTI
jgi:bifunctional DNA-binding transcriptional regulator/antitoxin component of YhaV-PrlF toxin-antitoxin module